MQQARLAGRACAGGWGGQGQARTAWRVAEADAKRPLAGRFLWVGGGPASGSWRVGVAPLVPRSFVRGWTDMGRATRVGNASGGGRILGRRAGVGIGSASAPVSGGLARGL